ncbi:hypothetical protein B9Z19DRAFT_650965 [Tuber borchii]|uniref:Uncharacterized protein n=1 Tax=Tuber borchii TaxID=42251 RepID=A0A2T7A8D5_TUBBO|nr:hypothetical protein B9Z19DRAFT_650965 [Tuber borchii]
MGTSNVLEYKGLATCAKSLAVSLLPGSYMKPPGQNRMAVSAKDSASIQIVCTDTCNQNACSPPLFPGPDPGQNSTSTRVQHKCHGNFVNFLSFRIHFTSHLFERPSHFAYGIVLVLVLVLPKCSKRVGLTSPLLFFIFSILSSIHSFKTCCVLLGLQSASFFHTASMPVSGIKYDI